MTEHKFTAEIARHTRAEKHAPSALHERKYETPAGIVRVVADWTALASDEDIVRIAVRVTEGGLAPRDVPAFVELFFHDAFLMFNIATPGSFEGEITVTGGEFRVNDLSFDASPFACATSSMPLAEVAAWYPATTQQIASTPMQKVLFHLLHIGRGNHHEWMLRARLQECLKALGLDETLEEIAIVHPMHDEILDARVDDGTTEIADRAMNRVLTAIQEAARG